MKSKSQMSIFILLIFALMLGVCGLDLGGAMPDPNLDESGSEDVEPSEQQLQQQSGEDKAEVYYRYHMNDPNLKSKMDMPFGLDFVEMDQGGSSDAAGIFEDRVTFTTAGTYTW